MFSACSYLRVGQELTEDPTPFTTQLCPDRPVVLSNYVPAGEVPGDGDSSGRNGCISGGHRRLSKCGNR